jgi:hypothetical protein
MCSAIKFVKLLLFLNEGDDRDEISTENLLNGVNILRAILGNSNCLEFISSRFGLFEFIYV